MSGLSSSAATFSVDQQSCELAARLTAAGKGGYNTYALGAAAYSTQLGNLLGDMGSVPRNGNLLLNTPKLDWQVNDKHHVSVLYHRVRWDSPGGVQTQGTNNYAIDSFGTDFVKVDYGLIKLDSLITSSISNEVRYQYGRELNDEGQQPFSAYSNSFLKGLNGITNPSVYDFSPNITFVELDNPHPAPESTWDRRITPTAKRCPTNANGRWAIRPRGRRVTTTSSSALISCTTTTS